jgi:hypothetical protein
LGAIKQPDGDLLCLLNELKSSSDPWRRPAFALAVAGLALLHPEDPLSHRPATVVGGGADQAR